MGISSTLIILIILLVKKIFNKTLTTKWHYYIWILLIIRLTTQFYVQGNVSVQNSKVSFTDNKEKNTVNSISNKKILKVNKNYSSLWVKACYLWISVLILIFAYILLVNIFVTVKIKAYKESFQNRILFH
ncbi:M56 family metallopeptidase [Clostridium felsineum]|uniref:M56 family metallopeptidase n=1 Tax=Clostridium felsineum TaxID=36839 RepID=UPI00396A9C2B